MRVPRVRFTVRGLMVAVAAVALSFEAHAVHRRWTYCRDAASYYGVAADCWLGEVDTPPRQPFCGGHAAYLSSLTDEERSRSMASLPVLPTVVEHQTSCLRTARYHLEVKRKFERASWRFWEPVPMEPPEPPGDQL